MSLTSVRLTLGDVEVSLFDAADRFRRDLILQKMTFGSPAVRESVTPRTDADGVHDVTARHGARSVAIELKVFDTPAALVDQLNRLLHPRSRPHLVVDDDEWSGGPRRMMLRSDQWTSPLELTSDYVRDVALTWTAPSGVWEAASPTEVTVIATAEAQSGVRFPIKFPLVFSGTTGTGQTIVVNPGTSWSDQVVRLYGPCVGPRWHNDTTGEVLAFTDALVIPAGEYVELNTRDRTAYYLSDPNADRLGLLDFESSTWWQIPPGESTLRYAPISGVDAGCVAALSFRPAHL